MQPHAALLVIQQPGEVPWREWTRTASWCRLWTQSWRWLWKECCSLESKQIVRDDADPAVSYHNKTHKYNSRGLTFWYCLSIWRNLQKQETGHICLHSLCCAQINCLHSLWCLFTPQPKIALWLQFPRNVMRLQQRLHCAMHSAASAALQVWELVHELSAPTVATVDWNWGKQLTTSWKLHNTVYFLGFKLARNCWFNQLHILLGA